MKVVPFQVPHTRKEAFRIQLDRLPHFYNKLHQHNEIQIMWIEKSQGTLVAGDYVGRFGPGDLYVLGSHQAHVFKNDPAYFKGNSLLEASSISIFFAESYVSSGFWQLEEMEGVRNWAEKATRGYKILGTSKSNLVVLIKKVVGQKGIEKLITFFSIVKLLSEATETETLSVMASTHQYGSSEGKRMDDILQFTLRESHRKVYIEEVAKVANLTEEAFCRYFKTRTGKTYTNFLNEVRVSQACKLLIDKDLSIQDVCYQAGFTNLSNFNRAFKKITGKTPSKYMG
ncbi:MAG: AraC family transcriptional regulator [Cyclobacteriaceae bacterium]|nr:helix-turn-helix domain-containing protein [Cyclobacteriaceae bacterium]MCB0498041.1 helix-turn-helix domain-containing protein [Cyclobacteriaceae bacterium]MCB9238765.1 helix-turn-helix transcriptional regulator [Flammeovirgaceae bacterium]MCO5270484.1 AraC family transcriptional regulator [Cyclobacteriaceae bacterium]MCW5901075.1 helix-turn-helix domain-containing protein [Cyclobacteriaceae bacterium]